MAIAKNIPINRNTCRSSGKQTLDRASKSVTPVTENKVRIANNKNRDPNTLTPPPFRVKLA